MLAGFGGVLALDARVVVQALIAATLSAIKSRAL